MRAADDRLLVVAVGYLLREHRPVFREAIEGDSVVRRERVVDAEFRQNRRDATGLSLRETAEILYLIGVDRSFRTIFQ